MPPEQQRVVMAAHGAGAQYGVLLPCSRDHETEADAVFVNDGALVVQGVAFRDNAAVGGGGGHCGTVGGTCSGGGGIGGDGEDRISGETTNIPGGVGGSGAPPTALGGASNEDGGDGAGGGGGGRGAGLGGPIFVRAGTLRVETVDFVDGAAVGGVSSPFQGPGVGGNGQGKGAAIFVADGVDAHYYRVALQGNDASDATGQGILSGLPTDSDDAYGVLVDQLLFKDAFE